MKLVDTTRLLAGGPGSGCHGDNCGKKPGNRIAQMDKNTWVSKDGTKVQVRRMTSGHLISVLRQLHQQLYLARGEQAPGVHVNLMSKVATDGKVIENAIAPYRAMVEEAKKRKLIW